MEIEVVATDSSEEQRSLYKWLAADYELRGRVRLEPVPPEPGALGGGLDYLIVMLGPGMPAALAGAVVAWLRYRTSDVRCVFTRPDRTRVEMSTRRVKDADIAELRTLINELSRDLAAAPGGHEDGSGAPVLPRGE